MADLAEEEAAWMGQRAATRKIQATTLFALAFSPCGRFLAAAGSYGTLSIWRVEEDAGAIWQDSRREPIRRVETGQKCIYDLQTCGQLLLSASMDVVAWSWTQLQEDPVVQPCWRLQPPQLQGHEINSIALQGEFMFLGCGNGQVLVYNVTTQREQAVLRGHTDLVHCVKAFPRSAALVASGSEDGTVRVWDTRSGRTQRQLSSAPGAGGKRWIACMDVNETEDWLVCGGGAPLTLWHLSASGTATSAGHFDAAGTSHAQHVHFFQSEIVSLGNEPFVNFWSYNRTLTQRVATDATSLFAAARNPSAATSEQMLAVCGNGAVLNLLGSLNYRLSTVLSL